MKIDRTQWDATALRVFYQMLDHYRTYGCDEQRKNPEVYAELDAERGFRERVQTAITEWSSRGPVRPLET